MAVNTGDIEQMLEFLNLQKMAQAVDELARSPRFPDYSAIQFLREVVGKEFDGSRNDTFKKLMRGGGLTGCVASMDKLVSNGSRVFNENQINQLKTMEFIHDRRNICIFGETNSGKTYCAKALAVAACRSYYKTKYVGFDDLLDDLVDIKVHKSLAKFRAKMKYFAGFQVLVLDDFLLNRISSAEKISILFSLVKMREERCTTTIVCSQFTPEGWLDHLGEDIGEIAAPDAIRRRLVNNAYIVLIEVPK